jgi:hypothetical protein
MSEIVLLDTSVYLNVLDVPSFNQDREAVLTNFKLRIEVQDSFLLPMATILETGNHIADLRDGGARYKYAMKLVKDVTSAVNGDLPYRPTYFPEKEEFLLWLTKFPDYAKKNKAECQTREGVSLTDLAIIKEWERTRARHSMSRVLIWSLDRDLMGYD